LNAEVCAAVNDTTIPLSFPVKSVAPSTSPTIENLVSTLVEAPGEFLLPCDFLILPTGLKSVKVASEPLVASFKSTVKVNVDPWSIKIFE